MVQNIYYIVTFSHFAAKSVAAKALAIKGAFIHNFNDTLFLYKNRQGLNYIHKMCLQRDFRNLKFTSKNYLSFHLAFGSLKKCFVSRLDHLQNEY